MQADSSMLDDASPDGTTEENSTAATPRSGSRVERRTVLTVVGGAIAGATAGCISSGGPSATSGDWEYLEDGPDYDGWFDSTGNFEGTVDWTGRDSVTVDVGAGDGGKLFAPPAIRVDVGTTVTWEWSGAGGTHNVVEEDEQFSSGAATPSEGTTFEHTFEEPGTYRYVCEPHVGIGMVGAVDVV